MIYHCCDSRRRERVLEAIANGAAVNGIDFIEVLDNDAPAGVPRQQTLLLRFLAAAPDLAVDQFELAGGERITGVAIEWVTRADAPDVPPAEAALAAYLGTLNDPQEVLALRTSSNGDHATYTLRLVAAAGSLDPPAGIDRVLSVVDFSFKVECPTGFDCAPRWDCPPDVKALPALSYLAKDYQTFRRLMRGRMAEIMPAWREQNAADLGVTLVELLAYTADRLSYAQDAAASEAYLSTARLRSSVRRHARLVDYRMHDGANARAFVHLAADADGVDVPTGTQLITEVGGLPAAISSNEDLARALAQEPMIFETLHEQRLFTDHNAIDFYEWSDTECCLPEGATRATLAGDLADLVAGDVLVFEEVIGPRTGEAADADPQKRHAVKLITVQAGRTDELTNASITEIRWAQEDALPFPLCISSRLDEGAGGGVVSGVSVARGNMVLADHGASVVDEPLGEVPAPHLFLVADANADPCARPLPEAVPPRFRPVLDERPVSQIAPYEEDAPSAFALLNPLAGRVPQITLTAEDELGTADWSASYDLLSADADDRLFVLEVESDGAARLRFGDGVNGARPRSATVFTADYRIGNGASGNVGREALAHILAALPIEAVRNPLAARGGREPETMAEARKAAPYAYRRQERAVTADDYAEVARRFPDVQRAAATFRWNGHGHTVFVTVDRFGGRPVTEEFEADLIAFLDRHRMAGYDLEVDAPRFAALELELFVCAAPDHFRSAVRQAVLEELGTSVRADGTRGFFHPDNFSFGEPVYLSAITARVMAVEGVSSVRATHFNRRGRTDDVPLEEGLITFGRLEIARLDNDPNFPERGELVVEMGGGK